MKQNIRQLFLSLFLSIVFININAQSPFYKARLCGEEFLKQKGLKDVKLHLAYRSSEDASTVLYNYQNTPLGYVIVAGSEDSFAVIGYSLNGQLPEQNSNESFDAIVKEFENIPKLDVGAIKKKYASSLKTATAPVGPLLENARVNFTQFNHAEVGGCPTGCTATGFALLMAYHRYPDYGRGSYSYTHDVYGDQYADFENTNYNLSDPDHADYETLSRHIGIALDMDYCGSPYGSTAYGSPAPMRKYFKYYSFYAPIEAYYIKNEIDHGRPVYIEVNGKPVGHALVIDGYDGEYFHYDFGWAGASNGYFLMNYREINAGNFKFGSMPGKVICLSPTPYKTSEQDSLALLSIYNSFDGAIQWDITEPVIHWGGVTVFNERVIQLEIYVENESNPVAIPSDIGDLTELTNLYVRANLEGQLTEGLGNLKKLSNIDIRDTKDNDTQLPDNIGDLESLISLNCSGLGGEMPASIGNLVNLKNFKVSYSDFNTALPSEICNLTNLEYLWLYDTNITGNLPDDMGNMVNLEYCMLSDNSIEGSLPDSFGGMVSLKSFEIANNNLSGEIPSSIGGAVSLETFDASNNKLSGTIPGEIRNCVELTRLYLGDNNIEAIENGIGGLVKLKEINLANNKLTALPDSIASIGNVERFYAQNNNIKYIPDDFGDWNNLQTIDLSENQINAFPAGIFLSSQLNSVNLKKNHITNVPATLEFLKDGVILEMDSNKMSGPLPESLFSYEKSHITFSYNNFLFCHLPKVDGFSESTLGYEQNNVPLKESTIKAHIGDTVKIDAREIGPFKHPYNKYYWYEYPENVRMNLQWEEHDGDPILELVLDEYTIGKKYYCKVFNDSIPKYKWDYYGTEHVNAMIYCLNTDTVSFAVITEDEEVERDYPNTFITSSDELVNKSISDKNITLVAPRHLRGTTMWEASYDNETWFPVADTMSQTDVWANVVSEKDSELILYPKTAAYYRSVVKESTCDPIVSDGVKVNPYGKVLYEDIVPVSDKDIKVSVDSIDVIIPANFSDEEFRLSIVKLDNPPAAPEGALMGSCYDVTVSIGEVFEVPLIIKLKNMDASAFPKEEIPNYRPVYYDDIEQKWVEYENCKLSVDENCLVFRTLHLTKIAWYNLFEGTYTHYFKKDKVTVYYRVSDMGNELLGYNYTNKTLWNASWRDGNNDYENGGNPYMVQDIAYWVNQIMDTFKSSTVNLTVPDEIAVYLVKSEAAGSVDVIGYNAPTGYLNISVNNNSEYQTLMCTLAHEYMHYTQDYYMTILASNYFWAEANAPLSCNLVWGISDLKIPESEYYIKDMQNLYRGIIQYGSLTEYLGVKDIDLTIFDLLSMSWDIQGTLPFKDKVTTNSANANLSSTYLYYMQTKRPGTKLDVAKMLRENTWDQSLTTWLWRSYLNNQVVSQLNSTAGAEYDAFVRYLLEGSDDDFTVINREEGRDPLSHIIKMSKSGQTEDFARRIIYGFKDTQEEPKEDTVKMSIPYLASRMVLLQNHSDKLGTVVRYKAIHNLNDNYKVYHGKYNSSSRKMEFVDISDKEKYALLLEPKTKENAEKQLHAGFLLFVNTKCPTATETGSDFNVNVELTGLPVISITDLAYANVGDGHVHNFTNGKHYYILNGCQDITIPDMTYDHRLINYSTHKTEVTDSSYTVHVYYEYQQLRDHGQNLPSSVGYLKGTQKIKYNFIDGVLDVDFGLLNTYRYVQDWDPVSKSYLEDKFGGSETENYHVVYKDIFDLKLQDYGLLQGVGKVMEFSTGSSEETRKNIQSMSGNFSDTSVDGSTVSGTYVSTDYSGSEVKITIWLHTDETDKDSNRTDIKEERVAPYF